MKSQDQLDVLDYRRNVMSEVKSEQVKDYYEVFFDEMLDYWDKHLMELFKRKKDLNVADSVIYLFKNRQNIENFNKKALYILIRERTGSNTQHITRVINQMKKTPYIDETTGQYNLKFNMSNIVLFLYNISSVSLLNRLPLHDSQII